VKKKHRKRVRSTLKGQRKGHRLRDVIEMRQRLQHIHTQRPEKEKERQGDRKQWYF